MKRFVFIAQILLIVFIMASCDQSSQDGKVFHVDKYDYKDWSKLVDVKEAIQLQENDQCLMSYAAKCIVLDDIIIYQDYKAKRIYAFSKDGKYLYTIGNLGHATSEYTSIRDFCVDEKSSAVMVLDDRGVICYNLRNGKFMERKKLSSPNPGEYEKMGYVGNSEFIFFTNDINDNTIVSDSQSGVKGLREGKRFHFVLSPFYEYNKEHRVLADYGDFYIDNYKNGKLETLYSIDLGKDALPSDVLPKTFEEFQAVDNSADHFKCIADGQENTDWLYLTVVGPKQEYYVGFFNKQNGTYAFGSNRESFEIAVIGAKNDCFYGIIYPEYASPNSVAKKILKDYEIDASKNSPVIVKFKINEKAI
jgi:hypothetical protein